MQTSGFDSFEQRLNANIEKNAEKVLNRTGAFILRDVKMNTPVDTGRLRRSWKIKKEPFQIIIYNNTKYAQHVEYGHRTKSGSSVAGRYMLRNAVERGALYLKLQGGIIND